MRSRSPGWRRSWRLLEKGDAQLADSLALFEEGTKLAASCTAMLDEAEQKVVALMKGPDGAPVETALCR